MVAPVEKIVTAPVLRTLPRRSLKPGRIVIVYAVFGLHPPRGRIDTSRQLQSTRGSPSRGEIRNIPLSDCAPVGLSLTVSSKRKTTSRGVTPVRPLSGAMFTISGASVSTGPPGGTPGDAHAARATAAYDKRASLTIRTASSHAPSDARAVTSTHFASAVRRRRRELGRAR